VTDFKTWLLILTSKFHLSKAIPFLAAQSNLRVCLPFFKANFCLMHVFLFGSNSETLLLPRALEYTVPYPIYISLTGIQFDTELLLNMQKFNLKGQVLCQKPTLMTKFSNFLPRHALWLYARFLMNILWNFYPGHPAGHDYNMFVLELIRTSNKKSWSSKSLW